MRCSSKAAEGTSLSKEVFGLLGILLLPLWKLLKVPDCHPKDGLEVGLREVELPLGRIHILTCEARESRRGSGGA